MPVNEKTTRSERLKRVPHFISAMIIMLHAFERFETGHGNWWFFAICGLVFLTVAVFHHSLAHRFRLIDMIFFAIEGILSFTIAWEYFHAGKQYVPYMFVLAGMLQFLAIYIFYKRKIVRA